MRALRMCNMLILMSCITSTAVVLSKLLYNSDTELHTAMLVVYGTAIPSFLAVALTYIPDGAEDTQ